MAQAARPVALLIARSMNRAHAAATGDFGWQLVAPSRYQTPDGEEVHTVLDRSTGLLRPRGTPVYLLPNWLLRDDQRETNERLADGRLVQVSLPQIRRL
jgi:hypothetical protein